MAMIECDRCGRDYSNKLMSPRYTVKELLLNGRAEEPLYLCPLCSKDLERFMEYKEVHILAGVEGNGSVE